MRSIPEKTLEHWASIYLANRFPGAPLWWPAHGEDVLVGLSELAASGGGMTLALELKTTEARGSEHVLEIDTAQLENYLNPPRGVPPLPVFYVFPTPWWKGPLTPRHASWPVAPAGAGAPPSWWRRRGGPGWFGNWLHVMPARAVATVLRHGQSGVLPRRAPLFRLDTSDLVRESPNWASPLPAWASPVTWPDFWRRAARGGPAGGVRWRTFDGGRKFVVLDDDQERSWSIDSVLALTRDTGSYGDDFRRGERVIVRIPD